MGVHGGDIYRNHVEIDFSVNVNPLGVPDAVKHALHKAVKRCDRYPDMEAAGLKRAVSRLLTAPEEALLFGNGASELFMAVVHGLKPRKIVIPIPSFYGYEYAARAAGSEIIFHKMKPENHFGMTEDICDVLTEDVDLLFLANPNNPTGKLLGGEIICEILEHCKERGICVVLDECFIEFSGSALSMVSKAEEFDNLILVRTFTKIFSIPGVRLGYLVCANPTVLGKIAGQLPEWNISGFAQEAGCACAGQREFIAETERYIKRERPFLEEGLRRAGLSVYSSMANYILFHSEIPLYEEMLKKGILIRDCGNFPGLCRGFFRVAVKSQEENEILLNRLKELSEWRR